LADFEIRRVAVWGDVEGDRRLFPFIGNVDSGPCDVSAGFKLRDAKSQRGQIAELELDKTPDFGLGGATFARRDKKSRSGWGAW
jgi:hypothetical protein